MIEAEVRKRDENATFLASEAELGTTSQVMLATSRI